MRDLLVWIGEDAVRQQVRLMQVCYHGQWYSYLTNELDPVRLPVAYHYNRTSLDCGSVLPRLGSACGA